MDEERSFSEARAEIDHDVVMTDRHRANCFEDRVDAARMMPDEMLAGRRRRSVTDAEMLLDEGVARSGRQRRDPREQIGASPHGSFPASSSHARRRCETRSFSSAVISAN